MTNNEICRSIYDRINSRRLTSKLGVTQAQFTKYGNTIDHINANRDITRFGDYDLSEYKIWRPLSGLVLPKRVTINGSERCRDLLLEVEDNSDYYNAIDFTNISYLLAGAFKQTANSVVSITRSTIALSDDVINRYAYNGNVAFNCNGIPMEFKDNLVYDNDSYYQMTIKEWFDHNIDDLINKGTNN